MTGISATELQASRNQDKIIVALDFERHSDALSVISELRGRVGAFKIGLQYFTVAGSNFVRRLAESGERVFLDLKFHDIPNTVAAAAAEAARLGVWMFNVHAAGGREMMLRTAEAVSEVCEKELLRRPIVIAVTVLTSTSQAELAETGVSDEIGSQVARLSSLASQSGLDGVVASPNEVGIIRKTVADPRFQIVTPGIRSDFVTNDDQKRVMSPAAAIAAGSDYLVIGRPVTQAPDRLAALDRILAEIETNR